MANVAGPALKIAPRRRVHDETLSLLPPYSTSALLPVQVTGVALPARGGERSDAIHFPVQRQS